tara:strand:- start:233111 stop:233812 length:702 start_codon:yes stop_codon:yes gene_type:complete
MNKEGLTEKYFSNRLSEAEFVKLQELLETDAAFREAFYSELEIQQALAGEKHRSLKERFEKLEEIPKRKNNWHLYAAAIAALIAIGSLFYNTEPNYQEVYAVHFEPYPNIVTPVVRNASETPIEKAYSYYNNRKYKDAIKAFEELKITDTTGFVTFYYAMSLMADSQVEKAINTLENPNWEIPQKLQSQTDWYLALSYLKSENKEKAIFYLEKVIITDGAMASQAKNILLKIK